jgi:hypothetical protein
MDMLYLQNEYTIVCNKCKTAEINKYAAKLYLESISNLNRKTKKYYEELCSGAIETSKKAIIDNYSNGCGNTGEDIIVNLAKLSKVEIDKCRRQFRFY